VIDLGQAVALMGASPWLMGRGTSLGIVGQLNAVAVGRKVAIRDRWGSLTWAELDERANRLVHVLADRGVGPGDRVALVLRNGREFAESLLACQRVGIVTAPLNTWARAQELRATLEGVKPALLIYDGLHADTVGTAAPKRLPRLVVGKGGRSGQNSYEAALAAAGTAPPLPVARNRGSARVVIHTSGTTGKPKGAARDPSVTGVREFVGLLATVPLRRDDVMVIPAPLFHSFGMLSFILGSILGATMVLPERFDPEGTLELIEEHRATAAALVPVMLNRIMSLPPEVRAAHDVSSIRVVLASGSAIPQDAREAVDDLFPEALYDLYGSTEAGWVAVAAPEDIASRPGTLGRPVWGVEVAVFSPEGRRLGPGQDGELHVKSAAIFEGYTGGEEQRGRDGYIGLGDLGHLDEEGYLYVAGRVDDMVVIGGENVYPSEVEAVIRGVAGVEDVAVFGVPDPEYGEVLAAFVVGTASPEDVTKACKQLASFKVPRRVITVDELPRTDTGKVLKRELLPLVESA
jgi:fatty-acyl-CoA synthase